MIPETILTPNGTVNINELQDVFDVIRQYIGNDMAGYCERNLEDLDVVQDLRADNIDLEEENESLQAEIDELNCELDRLEEE